MTSRYLDASVVSSLETSDTVSHELGIAHAASTAISRTRPGFTSSATTQLHASSSYVETSGGGWQGKRDG
uniref:Uncharacterized protein n=1 Tax=Oryza sativa subsp. japonica TaxID=39947 RepID=Q6K433_ORYSJ|nr:hypothetical protein [Oryza sativa Japonica Group]